jgi:hypothetical protein
VDDVDAIRFDLWVMVELAGIEPASSSVEPGLLRVQSVMAFLSAPALAQTRRRQA